MSTTVTVTLEKKEHILIIPTLSIIHSGEENFVQVWANNQLTMQPIIIGTSDGVSTEILQGLQAGDTITVKKFTITTKSSGFSFLPSR